MPTGCTVIALFRYNNRFYNCGTYCHTHICSLGMFMLIRNRKSSKGRIAQLHKTGKQIKNWDEDHSISGGYVHLELFLKRKIEYA